MKINIKYYKELLLEYKITFIVVFTIILFIGFIKMFITPNLYKSQASLEILQYNEGFTSLLDTLNQIKPLVRKPADEVKVIGSDKFLIQSIKSLNLTREYFIKKSLVFKAVDAKDIPLKVKIKRDNERKNIFIKVHVLNAKSADIIIYTKNKLFRILHKFDLPLSLLVPIYHKKINYGTNIKLPNYSIVIDKKPTIKLHNETFFISTFNTSSILFQIRRHLIVNPVVKGSNIINITYMGLTPYRAKLLVGNLLSLYNKQTLKLNTEQIKNAIAVISSQLKKAKEHLSMSAKFIEEYQSKHLLLNIKDEFKNIENAINKLQTEKSALQINKKIYETLVKKIMNHQNLNNIVVDDKNIMQLVAEKDAAISKEKELLIKYTPKYPEVEAVHQKIELLNKMINEKIINKLADLEIKEKTISNLIIKLNDKIASLPKYAAHLAQLKQKYNADVHIYQSLLKNKLQMTTNVAKAQVSNLIINPPSKSNIPVYPKKILWFIISFILATIGAFFAVLLKNMFNQKITKPIDVIRVSKYPLLGTIPFVKSKHYNKLFILDEEDIVVESFRKIRTNLEYVGNRETNSKTILITSSVSNEGKTTFAANLAVAEAMLNKKVVIVSFDLRIPQLHLKFNLKNNAGVSEILAGKATLKDVLQTYSPNKAGINSIDVITSGVVPPNPAELIESSRLKDLMKELKENYDIVIMDTPPVMTVSETKTLIKESDVTIFVLKAEKSRIDNLEYLNGFTKEFKEISFGLVLTSIQEKYLDLPEYDRNYAMYVKKLSK